jgi:hypothetical protein
VNGLALRSLRHPGDAWARLEAVLSMAAIAVCTLLVLLTLGARQGFSARADRGAWRMPPAAAAEPTARMAVRIETARDRPVVVVDWADLGSATLVPPGLDRPPSPGQVFVSPALETLLADLPADELAGRFPAPPAGVLGDAALVHPDELVAVVGRAPGDPAVTAARPELDISGGRFEGPVAIDRLGTRWDSMAEAYTQLATVATVLLILPLLTLGASAARLVAARRRHDLALVRLVGATTTQAARLAAVEALVLAGVGASVGAALYPRVLPLVRHVTVAGGVWSLADLWIGPLAVAATVAGVVVLVGLSALASLVPAVRQPLAEARASRPGAARAWRLAVGAVVVVLVMLRSGGGWRAAALPCAALLLTLNLAGPWAVKVLGLIMAKTSRRAPRLLAGRRLVEDPRSGWRAVSGMVLASFVAGFLAFMVPGAPADAAQGALRLRVVPDRVEAVAADARARLAAAGVAATVAVGPSFDDSFGFGGPEMAAVRVTPPADGRGRDRTRTALAGLVPGVGATSLADESPSFDSAVVDLRLGAAIVLVTSFLVAAVAAAVGGIGRVLDQRRNLTLLRLAGTPVSMLAAARRRELTAPLFVFAGGSMALGVGFALVLLGGADITPDGRGPLLVALLVAIGLALVLGGDQLSRPVLRAATADLAERE